MNKPIDPKNLEWRLDDLLNDGEISQVERGLIREGLKQDPLPDFPDDDTLVRFADGTLTGSERKAVQDLVASNVAAAVLVADIVREYSPIRRLSLGWAGWKGPILAATHRLPTDVSLSAWEDHLERNPRSRRNTEIARRIARPAISTVMASGWAVALLLLTLQLRPPGPAIHTAVSPSHGTSGATASGPNVSGYGAGGGSKGPGAQSKGIGSRPSEDGAPPGPREVEDWLFPPSNNAEILRYRIEDLEIVRGQHPESVEIHLALSRLYGELATLATDRAERSRLEGSALNERKLATRWLQQGPVRPSREGR